jgi:hypothetical protein
LQATASSLCFFGFCHFPKRGLPQAHRKTLGVTAKKEPKEKSQIRSLTAEEAFFRPFTGHFLLALGAHQTFLSDGYAGFAKQLKNLHLVFGLFYE